ncbi:MAG: hypothetical protein HDS65_01440 [Bacteroidales bacterium]|nr:hypothetical protein [Bacteroidales bacterium]
MHSFRLITGAALLAACVFASSAAPIDDVRKLYNEGRYEEAAEKARPLVKRSPRDGNANFFLGASLFMLGNFEEAVEPLEMAESKSVAEAARMLAQYSLDIYDAEEAREHLDTWEAILKKNKKSVPELFDELSSKTVQMQNMLDRVEKIEVLDTLTVDSAAFFRVYRLSPEAGSLLPPEAVSRLGAGNRSDRLSMAYMPENRSELLWAASDSTEYFRLFSADILDDGTIDHPQMLDESLAGGANALYPFLMPDGVTLYFASDGEGSLGGYDIFMTRRTDASGNGRDYFQPQNIGMPYNSPANDYLLAIDETTGLGWWASDRDCEPGKLKIFIFAPAPKRVNVDVSDPNLASLAMLSDISLTQKEGVDYKALLNEKLPAATANGSDTDSQGVKFALDLGNGRILYRLNDFKNKQARAAMLEAIATESTLRKLSAQLDALRNTYRSGDRSVASRILEAEKEEASLRGRILSQRNTAIRLESR